MKQQITLKFENEIYQIELPVPTEFTGSIQLAFHWKEGRLLKSEVMKRGESLTYPLLPENNIVV